MQLSKFALLGGLACLQALGQNYKVETSIPIGGSGGWDYLTADSAGRRLYVSHGTEVVVVDLDSKKVAGRVTGLTRIHGIAIDADGGKGFISDGGANSVVEFDLKTLNSEKKIAVGQNPDAIVYDSASKKVFTFNGRSADISVVDAASGSVVSTINVGGKPEFAVSDGKGNLYVNLEDKNEIVHLDSASLAVKDHWSIAPCDSPSGLAMDRANRRLFSVCDNEKMIVVNADSGKVVATPAIGKGPDAAAFDPGTKIAFSSNGQDGTLSLVKETSPDQFEDAGTVKTERGARTMALDEKTHTLYLSSAAFGPAPAATAANPRPRPSIQPGSFKLLVVSK
jgi:YVTN family beta-propeller protein